MSAARRMWGAKRRPQATRGRDGRPDRASPMTRATMVTAGIAPAVVVAGGGAVAYRRLRPDPAREMMRTALPAWQSARTHAGPAGGDAARELLASARRWPEVAAGFDAMDRAWPKDAEVRAAGKSVNR